MEQEKYKFAVLAADIVLFTVESSSLKILLIPVDRPPYFVQGTHFGAPGGLLRSTESAEDAAKRILQEKGGMRDVYMEQLFTFSKIDRDPRGRVVSVAYLALVPADKTVGKMHNDARWYEVSKLPTLAYDHAEVIHVATERLRAKLEYTNIAKELLPKEFTLTELQKTYEIILGTKLDKRNFRKKVLSLNLLRALQKKTSPGQGRPAMLYSFRNAGPTFVEVL